MAVANDVRPRVFGELDRGETHAPCARLHEQFSPDASA